MKTNAIRLLEERKIPFELREYEVDLNDLSAETVAYKIGLPPAQVFKTLVVKGDHTGVSMAVVPGNAELDLKALARLSGDRKAELVPMKDIQLLTGYVRGGVTAIASKKKYPVYLDASAMGFNVISVSAGTRGMQLLVRSIDYVELTNPNIGSIAKAE